MANGIRIGLIRIPTMAPPNVALALQQLDQEIAFFNDNTDGLVVDVMRNPGGLISFVEAAAQRFVPTPFKTMGFEIRATAAWLFSFASQLTSAELSNAPPEIIQNLRNVYNEVLTAYNENRGRSVPVSLNSTGSLTLAPVPNACTNRSSSWSTSSRPREPTCFRRSSRTTGAVRFSVCGRWARVDWS